MQAPNTSMKSEPLRALDERKLGRL